MPVWERIPLPQTPVQQPAVVAVPRVLSAYARGHAAGRPKNKFPLTDRVSGFKSGRRVGMLRHWLNKERFPAEATPRRA